MEVQTLVVSESEFSNLVSTEAIAITTPNGDVIPVLDTNAYAIAATREDTTTASHYSVIPNNTELTVGALALNVAEVFGEETNEFPNTGQQVHVIQHIDGSMHTLYNDGCLEGIEEGIAVGSAVCSENFDDTAGTLSNELMPLTTLSDGSHIVNTANGSNTGNTQLTDDIAKSMPPPLIEHNEMTNDSMLSFPVSEESTPSSNCTNEIGEVEQNTNTVVIDVSKPIQLGQNSLIVVNGQKCVLQQNPESGELIAYPVKEPDKPQKRRGRPR